MPLPTLPGEEKQEDTLNPGQQHSDRRFNDVSRQELADAENNVGKGDSSSNVASTDLHRRESEGDRVASNNDTIRSTFTGKNNNIRKKTKMTLMRKFGIFGGAGGIIGIVLFAISGILPIGGILLNLGEVATANRDTQSNILTRRLYKVIDSKMTSDVTSGSCNVVKVACRFSRPSNALLSRLDDYGIKAYKADGSPVEKTTIGFPNDKPTKYSYKNAAGADIDVSAKEFTKTLQTNTEFRKAFTSAYNMRYWGYADSYVKNLFYKKVGIDRSGKTTTSLDKEDPQKTIKAIADGVDTDNKVKAATSEDSKRAAVTDAIEEAATEEVKIGAKKAMKTGGDPALLAGTAACVAINLPGVFTKVARVYQMRQEIVIASAIVLTASSMLKSGDMDAQTMSTIGTLLTATAISSSGVKSKSAMDSFGIKNILFNDASSSNSSYKKFIPGKSAMDATAGITAFAQDPAVKSTCEAVASPAAQISVSAVEAGISAASGGIGAVVIGVLKAGAWGALTIAGVEGIMNLSAPIISQGVGMLVSAIPPSTIAEVFGNSDITSAKNEDLGNVIGPGISFFYSNAALETGSAPLTTSQLASYNKSSQDTAIAYAEQDRAGRSPFDISSPYTFLGSIVSNYYKSAYVPNDTVKTILSSVGYTLTQPFKILNSNTYAATDDLSARCGHAAEFGVDSSVAIGAFGDICPGIPAEYLNVPTADVLKSVDGQFNEETGKPTSDGDIQAILDTCGSGDLLNAKGCTITDQERANKSVYMTDARINDLLDGREYTADGATTQKASSGKVSLPVDAGYSLTDGWIPRDCKGCASFHVAQDFTGGDQQVNSAIDGTVIAADKSGTDNNVVRIQASNGVITEYWHMAGQNILVNVGDVVTAGQKIGIMGCVGVCSGTHLHFMVDVTDATDPKVKAITTRPKDGRTYAKPSEWFALYGISM